MAEVHGWVTETVSAVIDGDFALEKLARKAAALHPCKQEIADAGAGFLINDSCAMVTLYRDSAEACRTSFDEMEVFASRFAERQTKALSAHRWFYTVREDGRDNDGEFLLVFPDAPR